MGAWSEGVGGKMGRVRKIAYSISLAAFFALPVLCPDPKDITEAQFYECEHQVLAAQSGSGGYFLDEASIQWLKRAEEVFEARGVQLKGAFDRHFAIADSYFNDGQYEKALKEYQSFNFLPGIESAEWFIHNKGTTHGEITVKEYPGDIACRASETARAEDARYLFRAFFKDGVYRYDKAKHTHALIYSFENRYNWCERLAFDGKALTIGLIDDREEFIFNNKTQRITHHRTPHS